MTIIYSKASAKFIKSTDKNIKQRIRKGILGLKEIPPRGDIKYLQGMSNIYRLRIGKYRILYEYRNGTNGEIELVIIEIGSRGEIYK